MTVTFDDLRSYISNNPEKFSPQSMSSEQIFALKIVELFEMIEKGVPETKKEPQPKETEEGERHG